MIAWPALRLLAQQNRAVDGLDPFSQSLFRSLAQHPRFQAESARLAAEYGMERERMVKAIIVVQFRSALSGNTGQQLAARAKAQTNVDARYCKQEGVDFKVFRTARFRQELEKVIKELEG